LSETNIGERAERAAWASALMPIVLHELNNVTQYLSMLHSVTSQDPESGALESSAADLAQTASSVEDLGLLMAILSTATGTDLMLARRSERGAAVVAHATTRMIRKLGRDVSIEGIEEPVVRDPQGQGWELPWALGASWWIAAAELERGETLGVSLDSSGWSAAVGGSDRMRAHVNAVGEVLPQVQGEVTGATWRFAVPEGWLAAGDARELEPDDRA